MTAWCRAYAEQCDQWTDLGGVPGDLSTRDHACRVLLALWTEHRALTKALHEMLETGESRTPSATSLVRSNSGVQCHDPAGMYRRNGRPVFRWNANREMWALWSDGSHPFAGGAS